MKWTLSQRIAVGYGVIIALLVVVAGIGMYNLSLTTEAFTAAMSQQKLLVKNQPWARATLASANVELLRYLLTQDRKFLQGWERWIAEARKMASEARDSSPTLTAKTVWEDMLRSVNLYEEAGKDIIAAETAGRHADALKIRTERFQPIRDQMFSAIDQVTEADQARLAEIVQMTQAGASRAFWVIFGSTVLALVAGLGIAWMLTKTITGSLRETINTLATASAEIVAATAQQASGTAEEATAVQETSTTVDEVKQTAQVSAEKVRGVAEVAQTTAQVAGDGLRAVDETVKGVQETKARMEAMAERILTLSEQAQAIGEIIASVTDLADQSNLLAVNAAIEAAKAGEAGKGFAVVAGEVKSLAEQSKQATAQVRGILNEIQRATQAAVMAAEQGVKAAEAGVGLAARSGEAIRRQSESVTDAAQAAQQILAMTQQQAVGMDQIALAMRNIQQSSSQNMAATRQVERAAQNLKELAQRLATLVAVSGNGVRVA